MQTQVVIVLHGQGKTGMFSVSESGCDPSSFTATSETPADVEVSLNDGLGDFTVTALAAPVVHRLVDVTDCHGFTTTKNTTPPSVKVQIVH